MTALIVAGHDLCIPIVHIPRAEIVQAIVDADDYDARIEVIEECADDIAVDCSVALAGEFDDGLEKQILLVRKAIEAYQAEHFEAAQGASSERLRHVLKDDVSSRTHP